MKKVLWRICATVLPLVVGFATMMLVHRYYAAPETLDKLEFILNALITCAATFAGFILTSVAILLGMTDNAIVRKISKSGSIVELTCMYATALVLSVVLIVFCAIVGFHSDGNNDIGNITFFAGVYLSAAFVWSIVQSGGILIWIMHLASTNISGNSSGENGDEPSSPEGKYRLRE